MNTSPGHSTIGLPRIFVFPKMIFRAKFVFLKMNFYICENNQNYGTDRNHSAY